MNKLVIDRTKLFKPEIYFGEEELRLVDQCKNSISLKEINISNIILSSFINKDGREKDVDGEEVINRALKNGHLLLDAQILMAIVKDEGFFPKDWVKLKNNNTFSRIFFDGTIIRNFLGPKSSICLKLGKGSFEVEYLYLKESRNKNCFTATFKPN